MFRQFLLDLAWNEVTQSRKVAVISKPTQQKYCHLFARMERSKKAPPSQSISHLRVKKICLKTTILGTLINLKRFISCTSEPDFSEILCVAVSIMISMMIVMMKIDNFCFLC